MIGLLVFMAGGPFRTVRAGHVGVKDFFKLAQSPNSKIVVIGSSKNGLPLILGEK